MPRFVVQHQFDNEPTYIVDRQCSDESLDVEPLVTLHPSMVPTARRELGQLICKWLDQRSVLGDREHSIDNDPSAVMFRNHYTCYRCAKEWTDDYDAQPDDDCPECGARHVSPHKSEEIARDSG